jgi:nitroreductase/NAD-dependent dihydropyrimidine dehydrogenase PreA subunit
MSLIEINQQTCNKDGICAAVCPGNFINFNTTDGPVEVEDINELCIRCGHCVAACPSASLQHAEIPLVQCQSIQKELLLSTEQIEQFLRGRRSTRNYKDKKVERVTLQKLIETARCAPTGHNSQTVEWLVLSDREEIGRLVGIVADWMRWMLVNMPEVALSMHMDTTVERLDAGEDVILRDAPVLIVAHAAGDDVMAPASCTIALSYLELAATGVGLGGCWAGYFNAAANNYPPMLQALGLPEGNKCFSAMMLGHPQFRYHRLPVRNTPSIVWR